MSGALRARRAMLDASLVRMLLVIAMLVVTLAITAWMAVRAQYAAREHQRTAESVVRDWTRVAADELGRRAEAQATFFGTYYVLQSLLAGTPIEKRNQDLVVETFRYDAATRPRDPRLDAILAHPPPPNEREPLHDGKRVRVYAVTRDNQALVGFEVNRAALTRFFRQAMETRPLLPQSLANGRITNDSIRARATDADGRVLFATRVPVASYYSVRQQVDDGLLRGVTVEASLAPDVLPLVVAGGMPRTLPVYVVLLVVTGALLVTAMLQIQRERALARMRSDFVAGVSHELRTPLTQIRMFAETLLLDRVRSDDERKRSLAIIDQESRRLAQLVGNVLQFSRGERGMLKITPRRADVGPIVRDAVDSFLPIAHARGMRVKTSIEENAMANVDDDAIRQVVLNLLDNAAKYGPDGQTIRVYVGAAAPSGTATAEGSGRHMRIVVEDEGPGIPARQRKRIWRRYVRLPRERERAIAGAGIGLAVVRDLVKLHGGRAWCEGTRFVVEVPA
ncbi:MAG TPA: HAMP domain-containing sensor histidine kinase [Thermoanaerobaculia bacterium]|nr:HAMP domain-containing sensor histidine kinase [Thermoanaerobaculia bacterium]